MIETLFYILKNQVDTDASIVCNLFVHGNYAHARIRLRSPNSANINAEKASARFSLS